MANKCQALNLKPCLINFKACVFSIQPPYMELTEGILLNYFSTIDHEKKKVFEKIFSI